MPKDTEPDNNTLVGQSTALTILPIDDNRIFYYHGDLTAALQSNAFGVTNYSMTEGLGQIVRIKQAALDKIGKRKDLVVMVKPAPESDYQNLINVLDEFLINDVTRYAIMDITPEEKEIAYAKSAGK